jgi:beta-D-xylosidase 4
LAFISGAFGPKPYPIKTLVSYARLRDILPGKKDTARLEWTLGNLARYDEYGNTVLYPGEYTLTLDEPTQTTVTFTLEGEAVVLDQWPSPPS